MTECLNALSEMLTADRLLMAYYVFNCFAQSLPEPDGGKLYQVFYGTIHAVAGNINVVRKTSAGARFHQDQ